MRTNMPVTNVEYELKDGSSIVSKTDLKGLITYVNDDFIDASGFVESELIGQPHNLVRHPDMPVEAFEDLWNTLKKGRPWTGMVKNRRKDGGYYWEVANATPIWENGVCVGYMSVRSKPTRAQVAAHEEAYRLFREGKQGSLHIVEGKAVKRTALSPLQDMMHSMDEKARLTATFGLMLLVIVLSGLFSYWENAELSSEMQDIAVRRMELVHDTNELQYFLADDRSQLLLALQHDPANPLSKLHDHPVSSHTDVIQSNEAEIRERLQEIDKNAKFEKGRELAAESKQVVDRYLKDGVYPTRELILAGDYAGASRALLDKVNPLREISKKAVRTQANHEKDGADHAYMVASERVSKMQMWQTIAMLIAVVVTLFMTALVVRYIVNSMRTSRDQLIRISQGNYHDPIDVLRDDEAGRLLYGMKSMQIRMGFEVSESHKIADESLRIKNALDSVASNVTISDNTNTLIYLNRAARRQFEKMEPAMQKHFADFSAAHLVGRKLSEFFLDEGLKQAYGVKLDGDRTFNTEMGGCILRLLTSPVYNDEGRYLGRVTQWIDRTSEISVEREISTIVAAASNGDFEMRIDMAGKEDFFLVLAENMNMLMENSSKALNEVVRVLGALASGDLTQRMEGEYMGTFGQLKEDFDKTIDQLTDTIGRIKEAGDTINTASKEIASGNTDLSQRTEEQASSLEETAASMEELTSTVKQNAENAKQANQLARGASDIALKGGDVVTQVVHTMSSISDSSRKIVDIISVIDGIAFQTNILALNAAVEAARAGEQGRGFAVVASEVRNLAQRSAAAAKEIKELINDSVEKVDVGTDLVDKAGKTMDEVVTAVKRVTDIMGEITAASSEQSQGIEQVNQAITQMDDVTQQNAALVEEAAAAAESMEEQAHQLADLMESFRLSGESGARRSHAAPKHKAALPSKFSGDAFSFDSAVDAHAKWKQRLMDYINGKSTETLDVRVVSRDDQCPLGKWIYGLATKYENFREYGELRKCHADFHRSVGDIVQCVHDHDHDSAIRKLGGDFFRQSTLTVKAIRALQSKVEGGGAASKPPVPVSTSRGRPALPPASDDGDWEEF